MLNVRRPINLLRRCAAPGLALVLLSGCQQAELRNRVDVVEARLDSAAEKSAKPSALPPNAAPIRYSVQPDETQRKAVQTAILDAGVLAPPPFSVQSDDDGKFDIAGVGPFGPTGEAWLRSNGFLKEPSGEWRTTVAPADLTKLDHAVFQELTQAAKRLEAAIQAAEEDRAGAIQRTNSPLVASPATATGNALDFAFADDPLQPEFVIHTGWPQTLNQAPADQNKVPGIVVRGGRIIVKNGRVTLARRNTFRLVKEDVPPSATHLGLSANGMITAYDPSGHATELGRIAVSRVLPAVSPVSGMTFAESSGVDAWAANTGKGLFLPGYVEISSAPVAGVTNAIQWRNGLLALQSGLNTATAKVNAAPESDLLPLIIYTPLPKTTEHLKALQIPVEKSNERTSIGADSDDESVAEALVTVLQGLRRRMAIHEENLRNAGKTRDAEGRLDAYRRKTLAIGPQGNLVEGVDKSDLPKTYKPTDPDAGPDGFVMLSNVNKTVETAEFKATIEEYKLVRLALERLAPKHIFPDPPPLP